MKKIFFLSILLLSFSATSFAQLNIAYVDSDTIMKEYADAQDAQQKIDAIIQEWQEEIAKLEGEWKKKYDDYEKRKLILSDQKRVEIEKQLVKLEDEISSYKQTKFGVNGELFQKQDEIMKPIQNKVFNIINEIAAEEDYDFVFDRSGDMMFVFAKEEYDITALVLDKLKN
ncbi:MAG: OmpH family outer membrane protein [Ignavibacteriae bacterium]|nr:OmpH family outer membrane protein [Ignavibacteriota bacterium]NOG97010.1 OmpH family outer membrane protein [Ignavibacteriota bacterium]